MKLFFRSSHEMSVKIFRQSQLFSILSSKFLVAFLLNSLSVKSSWLEHPVLKHKKKKMGEYFWTQVHFVYFRIQAKSDGTVQASISQADAFLKTFNDVLF